MSSFYTISFTKLIYMFRHGNRLVHKALYISNFLVYFAANEIHLFQTFHIYKNKIYLSINLEQLIKI